MDWREIATGLLLSQGSLSVSYFAKKYNLSLEESAQELSLLINNYEVCGVYIDYHPDKIKLIYSTNQSQNQALFGITLNKSNNFFLTDHEFKLKLLRNQGLTYFPASLNNLPQAERKFMKFSENNEDMDLEIDEAASQGLKGILNSKTNNTQRSVAFTPVKGEPEVKKKIVSTPHPVKIKKTLKENKQKNEISDIFSNKLYTIEENTEVRGPMDNLIKRKLDHIEDQHPTKKLKMQTTLFPAGENIKLKQSSIQVKHETISKQINSHKHNKEIAEDEKDENHKSAQMTMMSFIIKNK
ncbi:unnamed protein product [Blepharisma stoltei]|uniref:DNA polymerase delta subunit 3 n=1 Tax=Blepharisma stoltei TaxID=1481888 RepID=A0AAU9IAQ7_9CILI|nr:unnamed protein product [Blepharisma stoltei]